MGAGFAELFLERDGSDGQAVPDSGRGVHENAGTEPEAKNVHAPGGVEPGNQPGARREKDAGAVPVGREKILSNELDSAAGAGG